MKINLALCLILQTFNGKKWEKFNSEKVASLAYARIEVKAALVSHVQNSIFFIFYTFGFAVSLSEMMTLVIIN